MPLLEEEFSAFGEDLRAPRWHKSEVAPDVPFSVAIIGAGMSGLLAAYRLQQVGVDFVVIEKNDDVGGTCWENQYPGCRVDNPKPQYSYSFARRTTGRCTIPRKTSCTGTSASSPTKAARLSTSGSTPRLNQQSGPTMTAIGRFRRYSRRIRSAPSGCCATMASGRTPSSATTFAL
jgi:hypothetical protein